MKSAKPDMPKPETVLEVETTMTISGDLAAKVEAHARAVGMSPADFLASLFGEVLDHLPARPKPPKPGIEVPSWVPEDLHAEYRFIVKNSGEEEAAAWARGAKRGRA